MKKNIKITELKKKSKTKCGNIVLNDVILEPHERDTLSYLAMFGIDMEVVKPANTPKTDNPDLMMLGGVWEMKSPESANRKTLKKRFHKASQQASNVVFDLRRIKDGYDDAESEILRIFEKNSNVRRIILIEKDGRTLDICKK